jgi:glycosidase
MKLIMDMVFNHCGSEHWWMNDLPSADWINYFPDYKITNHRRTVNQDPYAAEEDAVLMRDGWFVPTMPDLNQRNPFMAEYLIQNSIRWIEYLGLGGIRMDTYPYPDKYMMAEWCERVMEEYPNFNIVGEEWTLNPIIAAYWQEGKVNHDGYEGNLPSVMDFPMQNAVTKALKEEESWGTGLIRMYESLSNDYIYPDPYNIVIFPDNHDMPRFFMQLDMDQDLYKLGIAYFLTIRGIPQIYYGSEILMTHTESDSHGYIRKDFPGGWEGDEMNAFTGENMPEDALEMQSFFKRLLNWRKENPVIHTGDITHYAPSDGVYVYFRYDENDKVMVIISKNTEPYNLDLDRFRPDIGGSSEALDVIDNKKVMLEKAILLEPKTPYVLEIL